MLILLGLNNNYYYCIDEYCITTCAFSSLKYCPLSYGRRAIHSLYRVVCECSHTHLIVLYRRVTVSKHVCSERGVGMSKVFCCNPDLAVSHSRWSMGIVLRCNSNCTSLCHGMHICVRPLSRSVHSVLYRSVRYTWIGRIPNRAHPKLHKGADDMFFQHCYRSCG